MAHPGPSLFSFFPEASVIDRSVVVVLSSFFVENSKNTRNELARPVMRTIFLVEFYLAIPIQLFIAQLGEVYLLRTRTS